MYYAKDFVDQLVQSDQIVIYGARIVAKEVANCLMGEPYHLKITSFLVTDLEGNPEQINGIPVLSIQEGKKQYRNAVVLVAVLEKYLQDILERLRVEGFCNVIPVTFESDLWSELRGNYVRTLRTRQGKSYLTLEEELEGVNGSDLPDKTDEIRVYMAKCHVDRELKADMSRFDWEIPIQVGAAFTNQRIADLQDDQGDNISKKNREYCELTALYWIWKNDTSKFAGLCHYRRHFNLNTELLKKLANSDIDVVLTIPILNFPDVQSMYGNDHSAKDWKMMLEAIERLSPEYRNTAEILQKGVYYYAYNMFIARKEIWNDYCSWLFPILDYCEIKCGIKEDKYQNRYIGFLAERLLSIYFLHHETEYKIVHAQKTFLLE